MKILKTDIIKAIKLNFPQYAEFVINDHESAIFDLPNSDNYIGGLVIQLYKDTIWIRAYPPNSGCSLDTIGETIETMTKILHDELIIAVGTKGGKWGETTLNFSNQELILEEGFDYRILSWSGKLDKEIKSNCP